MRFKFLLRLKTDWGKKFICLEEARELIAVKQEVGNRGMKKPLNGQNMPGPDLCSGEKSLFWVDESPLQRKKPIPTSAST